jgi:hypothetical protein
MRCQNLSFSLETNHANVRADAEDEGPARVHRGAGSERRQYAACTGTVRDQGPRLEDDDEMFALVHQMRARVITSPSFTGERILGAILFEGTMDRDIEGQPTADYLWDVKRVVPFLKVDKGLQPEKDGVQLLKPMPELAALLAKGTAKHIFGTKMRSVIQRANPAGIQNVVRQQFEVAGRILDAGLVPIVEPEVDIHCPEKARAEALLKEALLEKLNRLPAGQQVLLKLTLPEQVDFYADCVRHPKVVRCSLCQAGTRGMRPTPGYGRITALSRASRGRCWKGCRSIKPMPSSTPRWGTPFAASTRRPSPEQTNSGWSGDRLGVPKEERN